jgi:proteic killer suppression protein
VIRTFGDATTEDIWNGRDTKAARRIPKTVWGVAVRKLDMLDSVSSVDQLRIPPSNRLHALKGARTGQYAIAVNDQYRITFTFTDGHAFNVCCEDYH